MNEKVKILGKHLENILNNYYEQGEFTKWIKSLISISKEQNVQIHNILNQLDCLKNNDNLCTKLFQYCHTLEKSDDESVRSLGSIVINSNKLGPICFITPEIGRWSTIGGLGVMVDELTQGLNSIKQDVIVISPYYDKNRKGESNYLQKDQILFQHICNINVTLDKQYSFGIHYGCGNGIKYYFIHNYLIFPKPYPDGSPEFSLLQISLFAKASLELLCKEKIIPSLIVTNDWFSGLTAGYAKNGCFGETFKGTTFFHICHNLEQTYEGRIYPNENKTLDNIHQLPNDWLIDPHWNEKIINPSRCAILMSDQWGTVSNSYKQDLLDHSPLSHLLRKHNAPFAFPNGIFKKNRLKILNEKVGHDRNQTKKYIQQKYFGYEDLNESVPVVSFVGRITEQKGVSLILEKAEELINQTNNNINILIGGMGNRSDPYVIKCIEKIEYLRNKYPHSFWANPNEFFTDGPAVNYGSDFGLMPSLFEPGGIVQHEFFIAGTPVIAFKTGGLKDTVFEYNWDNNMGNGILFDNYTSSALKDAILRGINLFNNKEKYYKCRENAFNSAIDVADVSKAWCREFYRLKGKIFHDINKANEDINPDELKKVLEEEVSNSYSIIDKLKNLGTGTHLYMVKRKEIEQLISKSFSKLEYLKSILPPNEDKDKLYEILFEYNSNDNKKINTVQLCGSFENWQVRHPLHYDPESGKWKTKLKLKKGVYNYKYIVDGEWMINPFKQTCTEKEGQVNNLLMV